MRWYLSHNGNTTGPHEGELVLKLVRQRRIEPGTFVRDEAASGWVPIEQSPFSAALRTEPIRSQRASHVVFDSPPDPLPAIPVRGPSLKAMLIVILILVVALAVWIMPTKELLPGWRSGLPGQQSAEQPGPAQQQNTTTLLTQRLTRARSVAAAVLVMRPYFRDTQNEVDPVAALFAIWAATRMTWTDLEMLPEVNRADVMKDPDAERGKRLCWSGVVAEIATNRASGAPIYEGGIVNDNLDVVRFEAVGSSADIVEHSWARVCGVVTGKISYANTGGGVTNAVLIVGMFDLPINRALPPRYSGEALIPD